MLIYKSITEAITQLEGKRLFRFPPGTDYRRHERILYVSKEIKDELDGALAGDSDDDARFACAYDALEDFVYGGFIPVGDDPFDKDASAKRARIDPVSAQVFDFRIKDESHGVRVFGRFLDKDKFVALTWEFREELDFNAAVQRCLEKWRALFGWLAPHIGREINDCFSANADFV